MPREIVQERTIREKKPWVVAAVAAVMVGLCLSFLGSWRAWAKVLPDDYAAGAQSRQNVAAQSSSAQSQLRRQSRIQAVSDIDEHLLLIGERRVVWDEFSGRGNGLANEQRRSESMSPSETKFTSIRSTASRCPI